MARQFSNPSGLFGKLIIGNMLNKANEASNDLVLKMLALENNSRVLEVGFGGGDLLLKISKHVSTGTIHGVEMSEAMVKSLTNKLDSGTHIHLHQATLESLPFKNEAFDRACSVNTIYFWPDLTQGLLQFSKVLQPEGILVLGFGSDKSLREAGYHERGFSLYSLDQISNALRNTGFGDIEQKTIERPKRGTFYVLKANRL